MAVATRCKRSFRTIIRFTWTKKILKLIFIAAKRISMVHFIFTIIHLNWVHTSCWNALRQGICRRLEWRDSYWFGAIFFQSVYSFVSTLPEWKFWILYVDRLYSMYVLYEPNRLLQYLVNCSSEGAYTTNHHGFDETRRSLLDLITMLYACVLPTKLTTLGCSL